MTTRLRLPSKEARWADEQLRALGYTLARTSSGHLVYEHDEQDVMSIAATPSDYRWRENFMGELRRRHPDELARRKATPDVRAARRAYRKSRNTHSVVRPLRAAESDPAVITSVPSPGSRDAKAQGCLCPAEQSRYGGAGNGLFAVVKGCPLHDDDPEAFIPSPTPATNGRVCQCGNPIASPSGRAGRPRKWCLTCRPSRWMRMGEDQREVRRKSFRDWYDRNKRTAA